MAAKLHALIRLAFMLILVEDHGQLLSVGRTMLEVRKSKCLFDCQGWFPLELKKC